MGNCRLGMRAHWIVNVWVRPRKVAGGVSVDCFSYLLIETVLPSHFFRPVLTSEMTYIAWDIETCPLPRESLSDTHRARHESEMSRHQGKSS